MVILRAAWHGWIWGSLGDDHQLINSTSLRQFHHSIAMYVWMTYFSGHSKGAFLSHPWTKWRFLAGKMRKIIYKRMFSWEKWIYKWRIFQPETLSLTPEDNQHQQIRPKTGPFHWASILKLNIPKYQQNKKIHWNTSLRFQMVNVNVCCKTSAEKCWKQNSAASPREALI